MRLFIWILAIIAALMYGLLVYSWMQEGNAKMDRLRKEKDSEMILISV